MIAALCYAELGTLIPESGAEYAYIKHGYGRGLAFLQAWLSMTITGPSGIAIITITSATYLLAPLYQDDCGAPPDLLVKLLASVAIGKTFQYTYSLYFQYPFISIHVGLSKGLGKS